MTGKTTTTYLVYWYDVDDEIRGERIPDLARARKRASGLAHNHPGQGFYIAAHVTSFRAEITVKEA